MALRNIVLEGDPILYKKCRKVEKFDESLSTLIDDMLETMKNSNGVGLAAPQIGILKRVVVINVGDGNIELVNPTIIAFSGEQRVTLRPKFVKVKAQDRFGNEVVYQGQMLKARAFCHEIDHLDGILFKSRIVK